MLRIDRVCAGYGGGVVLHDVDLDINTGTIQAVVGRNGAGKSTLVHAIAGLLRPYGGSIAVDGVELAGAPAHRVARAGVGLVPQGRRVFSRLTVAEHLTLAAGRRAGARRGATWTVPRVLELLPRLAERSRHRGNELSGGEQQMLALARALLTQPRVLLLDEPSEGLAPDLAARVRELVAGLADAGLSVLLVEQQLSHAIEVADRIAVLDYGRIIFDDAAETVRADSAPVEALLSISTEPTASGPIEPVSARRPEPTAPGPSQPTVSGPTQPTAVQHPERTASGPSGHTSTETSSTSPRPAVPG